MLFLGSKHGRFRLRSVDFTGLLPPCAFLSKFSGTVWNETVLIDWEKLHVESEPTPSIVIMCALNRICLNANRKTLHGL